jgi:hypothetical protein
MSEAAITEEMIAAIQRSVQTKRWDGLWPTQTANACCEVVADLLDAGLLVDGRRVAELETALRHARSFVLECEMDDPDELALRNDLLYELAAVNDE